MNKQALIFIFKVFVLSMIFSIFTPTSISNAAPNTTTIKTQLKDKSSEPTRFAGFAIGDPATEAVANCQDNLKYLFDYAQLTPTAFSLNCVANLEDKNYKTLVKNKPDQISILFIDDKIVGLHMLFTNKLAYKKTLADFVSSGIMVVAEKKDHPVIEGPVYRNHKENWYGWHYDFELEDEQKSKMYVIHIETSEDNEPLEQEIK